MTTELAVVTPEVDSLVAMLKAFDDFKNKALGRNDYAVIKGKKSVKRSGWSKYALACNVSTEVREERVEERDGHRIYHFTYRAIHPTGRYADAVGSASEAEKTEEEWNHPEHDVRSLAQTRAYNRAISNLVGGGEISAEELSTEDLRDEGQPPPPRPASQVRPPQPPPPQPQSPSREDEVRQTIESAGLDKIRVYTYGKNIHLDPTEPLYDEWQGYDAILAPLGAEWNREAGRWEIPAEGTR